jgi:citrate lyase beta subunit
MSGLPARIRRSGGSDILTLPVFGGANGSAPADLAMAIGQGARCIIHPDCRDGTDLQRCDVALSVAEAAAGLPPGSVGIVAVIASAAGLMHLPTFDSKSARLEGLGWDRAALCAGLDCPIDSPLADHASRQVAIAARALALPLYECLGAG